MKKEPTYESFMEFAEHLYTTRKIRHEYAPETVNNFHEYVYEDIYDNFDEYGEAWQQFININRRIDEWKALKELTHE